MCAPESSGFASLDLEKLYEGASEEGGVLVRVDA